MPPENLGLFDTPPSRKQIRYSLAIVIILIMVLVLVLLVPDVPLGQINAFIPMVGATTTLVDLIIATQLFVQASVFRSRALGALATGYVFTGLILIPHMLTFPGAFAPDGLLGAGVSTTAWIYICWRTGLPIAVILYVLFSRTDAAGPASMERPARGAGVAVLAAIALVVAIAILTTVGHDKLPQLYISRAVSNYTNMLWANAAVITLAVVSSVLLFRHRKSALDVWLLVVMAAWLVQTLLFLSFKGRFTAGWYFADTVVLFSHLYLMLGLIAESSRLYARLALSTALRNREREARLMSMDGITAAISHEVGQPLSAIILNASATLTWLTRDRPEIERAIKTSRDIIRDGQRTFDVIKSVRAMFAKRPGTATEFNLNDLVHETAVLRRVELDSAKIELNLELDPDLPSIKADRVQLQRVLVNLLTNAIESFGTTKRRRRKIVIRSLAEGRHDVCLEISDSGIGIASEEVEHIFDAFFTTKATGTGLGLALCRTIVEEHGGQLWASPGQKHGAVFHIRLPQIGTRILVT